MRRLLALLALAVIALPCAAQVYPVRPITLVIPFAPGGGADITGRLIAERLSGILKHQVRVENRPGGGGAVASQMVAQAQPDGYTLLLATTATMVSGPLFARAPAYDPLRSFTPVSLVTFMKTLISVSPDMPVTKYEELLALLKNSPGKYRYATGGPGTTSHLAAELFKAETGLDIGELIVKGPMAAIEAVGRGQAHIVFELSVIQEQAVREGKLRPLAAMAGRRVPHFPGVPTTAELGMPELVAYSWSGIVAPHGTPPAIAEVINRAVGEVLSEIETQTTLLRYRLQVEHGSAEEFQQLIHGELTRWSRAVPLSASAPR